ncbi:MAG TPA: hypothetical protein VFI17_03555 [Solirubrobacterales bacterium]|nr:hypothetical protein [Solirubrobacterales bacterium]
MSDALTPSFITVDAAGNVGAIFPGTIVAGNIKVGDLSEISPALGEITSGLIEGTTIRGSVFETNAESGNNLVINNNGITLQASGEAVPKILSTIKWEKSGSITGQVWTSAQASNDLRVKVKGAKEGPDVERTIINNLGWSSFLQLAKLQAAKVEFGAGNCGWNAGAHLSNTTVVEHGLGAVPRLVLVSPYQSEGETHIAIFNAFAYTETTFSVNGYWPGIGPGNNGFKWMAIV